jgi:hypothetical protein
VARHRARVVDAAGVDGGLPAAGLPRRAAHAAVQALEHADGREPDLGPDGLDEASREQLNGARLYFFGM